MSNRRWENLNELLSLGIMRKLEKVLLILMAMAVLAKLVPVVFNGLLITLSALTLSCLYFFFGFVVFTKIGFRKIFKAESYKHLKLWDIIISIFAGMALSVLVISLLFKLQYWPGAYYMSRSGLITMLPFIIFAVFMLATQNRFIYIGIIKRGIPLFLIVLLLHLLPLTTRLKIFKVDPQTEVLILNEANIRQ